MVANFDKKARAICTFAYCEGPGKEVLIFQGINDGQIVRPRGEAKFGWNPIFLPDGHNETYAEMTAETKNAISHRSRALAKLKLFLDELDGNKSS
jgi:inosine triphosphate pyrophosphatase